MRRRDVVAAACYVALVAGIAFGVAEEAIGSASAPVGWAIIVLPNVLVGLAIGRWWAPLLAIAVMLFAVGDGDSHLDPTLLLAIFGVPMAAALILLGVALHKVVLLRK